jgi:hypothetical protein
MEYNPLTWLKKLNRLKEFSRMSDRDILLIAADHLVGNSEKWFDVHCASVVSWSEFQAKFKAKYCAGLEDLWWQNIRELRQGPNESVEDIDVRLRELYGLVGEPDEKTMVRTFLEAINPSIAQEVERNEGLVAGGVRSLEDIVNLAIHAESIMMKYKSKGLSGFSVGSSVASYPMYPMVSAPVLGEAEVSAPDPDNPYSSVATGANTVPVVSEGHLKAQGQRHTGAKK